MFSWRLFTLSSLALASSLAAAQTVSNVVFNPPTFSAGQKTTGTVYLNAPAPTGGTVVNLTASVAGFTVPASVTVAAGKSDASFLLSTTVDTYGDCWITAKTGAVSRKTLVYSGGSYEYGWAWFDRASVTSTGAQGNGHSGEALRFQDGDARKISADGRYIVFTSKATNLVAGDVNRRADVFIRDRLLGTTMCVSQLPNGAVGNGESGQPCISADGSYVAFSTNATNLSPGGDTNGQTDVLLWRRASRSFQVVSRAGTTQANDASFQPTISQDGRYVAYVSQASNLVAGDTNDRDDIFVFDRTTGGQAVASLGMGGAWANYDSRHPSISGDGKFVAFESFADNLVPSDLNDATDVFVRDMVANTTARVSLTSLGTEFDGFSFSPSISADGKTVAFATYAVDPMLVGDGRYMDESSVLVRNLTTGLNELISHPEQQNDFDAVEPVISANGRFVAFSLYDWGRRVLEETVLYDRQYGMTINRYSGPEQGWDVSISSDGRFVAFASAARNIVIQDTNGVDDFFLGDIAGQGPVELRLTSPSNEYQLSNPAVLGGDVVVTEAYLFQPAKVGQQGVQLKSWKTTAATVPPSITITAGSFKGAFNLTTLATTTEQDVYIDATINSRTLSQRFTVVPMKLQMTNHLLPKGTTSATVKLRLSKATAAARTFYPFTYSQGVTVPSSVVLPANAKEVSFTMTIDPNVVNSNFHTVYAEGSGYYTSMNFRVLE